MDNNINNQEDAKMNYSLIMSNKVDTRVLEAKESGEYESIRSDSFNRDNSELLAKLENDISNQQIQKQEENQNQTSKNNKNVDQDQQQNLQNNQ